MQIDAFAKERSISFDPIRRRSSNLPEAELDVDDFLVEVNGSGVREALRLILDVEFEQPSILLVEEPEVHLHPALEIAMMRHLKSVSARSQVFITTHSTNFLDTGDMRNVYLLSLNGSTRVQHLNIEEAETEIPKELGIRLSSVFMFDRLLFVEGSSDELILREFAETLGLNLGHANVGFVVMGGSRNFTYYAAQATLSLLSKRQVQSLFLLDRDEQREDGIKRLESLLEGRAELHILQRREIENYLIDPTAIAELITRNSIRYGLGQAVPSPDEIAAVLGEAADELRMLSVAKRVINDVCRWHPLDRRELARTAISDGLSDALQNALSEFESEIASIRSNVAEEILQTEQWLDAEWADRKLEIVPGHELLDKVMSRYGLRFHKDRDGSELARLLPAERIPFELENLMRKVCG